MTTTLHPPSIEGTGLSPHGRLAATFGGALVTRSLFGAAHRDALLAEAYRSWDAAELQDSSRDDLANGRGGMPARRLWSGPGGPAQDAAYGDAEVRRKLSAMVGVAVEPSGSRGSYSYYTGDHHYLGLHRDVETCDLTTITVLIDDSPAGDPRGGLLHYPDRCHEPLSAIRADSRRGARVLKAPVDTTIVIAGGEVAHELLPVAADTTRVISVLCWRAATA